MSSRSTLLLFLWPFLGLPSDSYSSFSNFGSSNGRLGATCTWPTKCSWLHDSIHWYSIILWSIASICRDRTHSCTHSLFFAWIAVISSWVIVGTLQAVFTPGGQSESSFMEVTCGEVVACGSSFFLGEQEIQRNREKICRFKSTPVKNNGLQLRV